MKTSTMRTMTGRDARGWLDAGKTERATLRGSLAGKDFFRLSGSRDRSAVLVGL